MIPNLGPPPATDIQQAAGAHGRYHLPTSEKHQVPLTADWGRVLPLEGTTGVDDGSRLQPVRKGTELGLSLKAQKRADSESKRVAHLERQVALMLHEMGEAQRLVAGLSRKNAELQGEMAQLMLAHMVVGLAEAGAGGLELGNRGEGVGEAGGMEEGRGDSEEVIQPSSRHS
ncbi:unnamed protein product [Closterium sp. NIES-64]|nr:unnamed protein product [Closterium sp. NIES-64]